MGTSNICSALSMVPGKYPSFFDDALTPTALLFAFVFFFFFIDDNDDDDDDDDDNENDAANDIMCLSFFLSSLSPLSFSLSFRNYAREVQSL